METDTKIKGQALDFPKSAVIKEIIHKMPDDIRDRGLAYRDALSKIYWAVGDWVNECVAWAFAEGLTTNKDIVCAACSSVIGNELSGETLDSYSLVAARFPNQATRKRFEVFPFSHVKYFSKFDGEDRAAVIRADFKAMDERGGVPSSLSKLREEFEPHRSTRAYQETIARIDIEVPVINEAQRQIKEHLSALEGLLDIAAVQDAGTAVVIARAISLIHMAQKKVTGWKNGNPKNK